MPYANPLKTLLENMSEGICMVDSQQRIVVSSRRLAELLGFPDDLLRPGDPLEKLLDFLRARGEYRTDAEYEEVRRLLRDAHSRPFTNERTRTNGRTLEIRGNPEPEGGFVVAFADVTERRRAIDALRLSEERCKDFTEATSHFQWETDAELRITRLFDRYDRVAARTESEIVGRTLWEIVGIENPGQDAHWAEFERLMRSREAIREFPFTITSPEGRTLYRRASGRPVFDAEGRFQGYRCTSRDETAEVLAKQRAQAAEELLRQAVEHMSMGFGVFDPADRLVLMNEPYVQHYAWRDDCVRLGITFDELMRSGVNRGYYPEAVGQETAFLEQRLSAHREGRGRPFLYQTTDGHWLQVCDYRLPDGSTVVTRADVTELIARENALRDSQANLAAAQRIAKLGSWELDLDEAGNSDGKALRWSEETFRIFGYEPGQIEVSNDVFYRAVHPEDTQMIRDAIQRAVTERTSCSFEHRVTRPDGSEIVVREVSDIVFDPASGKPVKMVGTIQDITEQKQAEHVLRGYQARLDLALNMAKAAYWDVDPVADTHELSPNYYAMLGYAEREAPRGREAWRSLVHPDDIAQLDANQLLPPNDARDHEHEFRIRAKDGSWRWFVSHFRVTDFDRVGRPAHLLGIDTDVTGRKQGELALQQAHERAQLYLDVAGVIIVVLDVNQRVTLLNRKGCEILGVSEEEVLGRDWFEVFSPDAEREAQRATYAAFLAGGKGTMTDVEMTVRTRRRDVRLITWHDSLLHDETGAVIGCMSSGEDITEQRAVQGKRDEFRALIEATAQASPDGIVVIAPDGRYLFWNNRYREMWQLGEDYLRSRQAGRPLTADPLKPFMDQVTEPGSFREKSLDIQRGHLAALIFDEVLLRDGRIFVRHAARVSAGNPPVAAIAWIYRDVTEQRKRDAELAQSQRLTAVGQLSGGVAHELNNLLTVISGNLELIQGFADAKTRISELTTPALSAVERGSELTRGLLAFSRQQALAPQLTDVNALIPKVIKILPHLLGGDVRISFVSGIDLGETIVDPGQLETALINLATNARDALPTGGSLVIETGNRVVDEADREQFGEIPAGEYVVIAVTDNGLGMPPEVAKRAFEPFFTTKEVGKGTGLGLSMVFGFVKQSGGHVSLYSEQGAGTTVRVYLPRAPVGLVAGAKPSVCVVTQGDSQRILLVEDEPAVSAITRGFLESLGYRVIEARNGPEALAMLQRGDPVDLLLTDVMLPDGMNGAEVARAALTLRPDLKVLYYSGYTEEALIRQGRLEAGVVLLQKPFRRQDLAQAVSRVLSRSAAIPSLIRT